MNNLHHLRPQMNIVARTEPPPRKFGITQRVIVKLTDPALDGVFGKPVARIAHGTIDRCIGDRTTWGEPTWRVLMDDGTARIVPESNIQPWTASLGPDGPEAA